MADPPPERASNGAMRWSRDPHIVQIIHEIDVDEPPALPLGAEEVEPPLHGNDPLLA
jgi:hypothetical protein